MQALSLDQLRAAAGAGGIASVTLEAQGGAFIIAVATQSGDGGLLVATRTRRPRRFADIRKAMLLLRELGITTAKVDATNWDPAETKSTARPDRSEAMKRAHEALAHDRWFRAQVEDALLEANDLMTARFPHEQVMAEMRVAIDRATAKTRRRRGR